MTQVTATLWFFDEPNYLRFKAICEDGRQMPGSYAVWLAKTSEKIASLERGHGTVKKIKADPDDFLLWCKSNAVAPNKLARVRYANARALNPNHSVS